MALDNGCQGILKGWEIELLRESCYNLYNIDPRFGGVEAVEQHALLHWKEMIQRGTSQC